MPLFKLAGKPPKQLGVQSGRLRPSGSKPNCVCSYETTGYAAIKPISIAGGDANAVMQKLKSALESTPGIKVVTIDGDYLHAEATTPTLGFVDDLEFLVNTEANQIHLRSQSRLGYSDMGQNRKRIEAVRRQMA